MRRVFIGDVHGCREELEDLLQKVAPSGEDQIVFLGDLIDRGPDSPGVVRLARSLPGAISVLGNHEEKALRWLRHDARAAAEPRYKNPMVSVDGARIAEWRSLSGIDIAFLAECPPTAQLGDFMAVHGGFLPHIPVERQRIGSLVRLRWVDAATGNSLPGVARPEGARPWAEVFNGPFHVVCGHAVHSLSEPRIDRMPSGYEIWSIDTGCVFGGRLTALIVDGDSRTVVQISARRPYADPLGEDIE